MMRRRSFRLLALTLACIHAVPAAAQDIEAVVGQAVRPLMAEHQVPGMAVAVTIDGKAMFFNYGVASKSDATPVSEHTLFELGSISKTFTATLAGYAAAQGRLALGDHPGRHLPQLKGSPIDRATLLELGTYTAGGLPLQFPDDVKSDAQMPAWFRAWQPDAAPGTQRRYSNPSIGLLGRAAALALETDFRTALEGRIFPALGLAHTWVRVPAAAMPDYAWGYKGAGDAVRVGPGVFDEESYGVKSSAADMIRFVQANIDPARLAAPLRPAVEATQVGYFKVGPMVQGLGWEQYRPPFGLPDLLAGNAEKIIREANPATRLAPGPAPRGTLFNKTGSTGGFGAYALFVPARRIGIVMLANKNYPIPARVAAAYAILEGLAPGARP